MTCLSNMSVESVSLLENEMQQVTFLKTPIMATYVSLLFSLFFCSVYPSAFSRNVKCTICTAARHDTKLNDIPLYK